MRVLGLDPGSERTGWGCVALEDDHPVRVASGVFLELVGESGTEAVLLVVDPGFGHLVALESINIALRGPDGQIIGYLITSRESHLHEIRGLVKKLCALDKRMDEHYVGMRKAMSNGRREKLSAEFQKLQKKLELLFPKFFYKQKVLEEMALVAENVQDKLQLSLRLVQDTDDPKRPQPSPTVVQTERHRIHALETVVRMPARASGACRRSSA